MLQPPKEASRHCTAWPERAITSFRSAECDDPELTISCNHYGQFHRYLVQVGPDDDICNLHTWYQEYAYRLYRIIHTQLYSKISKRYKASRFPTFNVISRSLSLVQTTVTRFHRTLDYVHAVLSSHVSPITPPGRCRTKSWANSTRCGTLSPPPSREPP